MSGPAVVVLASAGCLLGTALAGAGPTRPTVIKVIAGKPQEFAFQLSRFSELPAGPMRFVVENQGAVGHDFELCVSPVSSAAHNSCAGYQSKDLQPGERTTITIGEITKGRYEFLSADPGDAAAGMKGLIGVGVFVKPTRPVRPSPPPPSAGPPPSLPVTPASSSPPAATTDSGTTTTTGGYICKQGHLVQGVSTPNLCN